MFVNGLQGGDNFALNSPSESLAFILSDAGYDVWLGNNRCVQWSHGHQSYTSSNNVIYMTMNLAQVLGLKNDFVSSLTLSILRQRRFSTQAVKESYQKVLC
jgi:hypothetical protein